MIVTHALAIQTRKGISSLWLGQLIRPLEFSSTPHDRERSKIIWLIKLRWLFTAFVFGVSILGLTSGYFDIAAIRRVLGVVGILMVYNIVTRVYVEEKRTRFNPVSVCFHMAFDLFCLTLFLVVSGGFANPLVSMFFINAAVAGILIGSAYAWPYVILLHTCLAFLQFSFAISEGFESLRALAPTFAAYHFIALASWFAMRSLGSYLDTRQNQQAAVQSLKEKQDRLRAIGALSAGFSHEFASPLHTAKLRLSRALKSSPQDQDLEIAVDALKSCELVLRKMNSSQLDPREHQLVPVDLKKLVTSVVTSWQQQHPEAVVSCNLSDVGVLRLPLLNFSQALLNLLDNAFESAPRGVATVTLHRDSSTRLSVRDEGPGFSASVVSRFGEPFVTEKSGGTGLGLYVTQLFAQSLGGELSIANAEFGGLAELVLPLETDSE